MSFTRWICLGALVGLLSACSDPRDAGDSNFTRAINTIMKQDSENPLCYIVSTQPFPLALRKDGRFTYGASLDQMNALVKVGVLAARNTVIDSIYEGLGGARNDKLPATEFSLTEVGKLAFRDKLPMNNKWPQGGAGFCFGQAEVDDIKSYTQPKAQQGGTMTTVKYVYKVKQAEAWAESSKELQAAFPEYGKASNDGVEAEIKLERGVKGWRKSRI